jgi:hypothetical protein
MTGGFSAEQALDTGPEPVAAQAELELTQQRLYAAENALVRRDAERAGIAADLQVVLRGQEWRMLNGTGEFRQAFEGLLDVAWPRSERAAARAPDGPGAANDRSPVSQEAGSVSVALSAAREPTWTTTRPALAEALAAAMEQAGIVMVFRDDLRLHLRGREYEALKAGGESGAAFDRLSAAAWPHSGASAAQGAPAGEARSGQAVTEALSPAQEDQP